MRNLAREALVVGRLHGRIGQVANTGWTDEARDASLAVRQAKAAERRAKNEKMFHEQKDRGGDQFIEGWYPRGSDGYEHDPHYGETGPDAPYGYRDSEDPERGGRPRTEPLYDREGRPIIPRSEDELVGGKATPEMDIEWRRRSDEAMREWGPFGRRKRYMREHPGASEAEWEKYDREEGERKRGGENG